MGANEKIALGMDRGFTVPAFLTTLAQSESSPWAWDASGILARISNFVKMHHGIGIFNIYASSANIKDYGSINFKAALCLGALVSMQARNVGLATMLTAGATPAILSQSLLEFQRRSFCRRGQLL
jgi:hypothetical protein